MTNLDDIVNEGFKFDGQGNQKADLAFISLSLALQAYFSTYQTFKSRLFILDGNTRQNDVFFKRAYIDSMKEKGRDIKLDDVTPKNIDLMKKLYQKCINSKHNRFYREAYFETIIHFQHFAELVCKQLLRNENDLLVDDLPKSPVALYKHIKGMELDLKEKEDIYSIELSETIKRLDVLIKKGYLIYSLNFKTHKKTIEQLNKLRNRLWHRGLFILYYPALDIFIGKYVLPFVHDVLKLPEFSNANQGKYQEIFCSIDPIAEIIKESNDNPDPDLRKIAFLNFL